MPPSELTDRLAKRYLWWLKAPQTESDTDRLIVQVMNIGDLDDTIELLGAVGDERFRAALKTALPDSFGQSHGSTGTIVFGSSALTMSRPSRP